MRNINSDLKKIIEDFPNELGRFSNFSNIRKSKKEILSPQRLNLESFEEPKYWDLLKPSVINDKLKIKILFSHFSPFEYEVEGLGLPLFFKKAFPNCTVDFTYDKSSERKESIKYRVNGSTINKIPLLEDYYDIVAARSSSLISMMHRVNDRNVLERSTFKVNVKTMSYAPNYKYADCYFKEVYMSPPADPDYNLRAAEYFNNFKKNDIVVVPGTIKNAKGQLTLVENLDSNILKGKPLVFLGSVQDKSHELKIREICENKGIEYYLLGFLNREVSDWIKNMAKVSIFQYQPHLIPSGYPRSLGESISSRNYAVVSDKIIVPPYYEKCVLRYKSGDFKKMNELLKLAISKQMTKASIIILTKKLTLIAIVKALLTTYSTHIICM